ncbi:hypothetical protein PR202_ga00323 [Eleusine coracana subsp. coracana]|uniref:SHSP domain-containing protein n=1 Tax=Eleusine coracana subsp. coracana TaxID=191504 RepID=A0AAV5BFW5_ELECO|nr:hypothetical protein PR202_ga00323 [Eleusine coracana subsp. coracana]
MDPSGRAYEDFVPPHSMVREPPTHTLSVDLTAAGKHISVFLLLWYKKEHIRVQLVHSHRRLIVRGERPVAGNRWSRFRLEFKLPDDCDVKGIQAKFEKGVVRVTMPGQKPETVQEEPAKKPTEAAAPSGVQVGAERQDGDHPAPAPPAGGGEEVKNDQETKVQKQEAVHRRLSSAKDGGRDDGAASEGEEATAVTPSSQGYAFMRDRKKMATTVLGVVLALISLGIYVKYSLWP